MPSPTTNRQQEIATFLDSESRKRGMMPTQGEIGARLALASPNAVRSHLRLMEKKGMLSRLPGTALKLKSRTSAGIPLLGRIAAGKPQEALQNPDDIVPMSSKFFRGADRFALRVKSDSMRGAGILSGDIAVLNRQQDVADGDIAAVLLDDDATIKFLHRRRGLVVLRGGNPIFADIVLKRDEARSLRIFGKYVDLIRQQGRTA